MSSDSPIKLFWSVTVYDVDTRALKNQGIAENNIALFQTGRGHAGSADRDKSATN